MTFIAAARANEISPPTTDRTRRWLGAILLLIVFHFAENWLWTSRNFQSTNWDDQQNYWNGMLDLRAELHSLIHDPALGAPRKLARACLLTGRFHFPHWSRLTQWVGLASTRFFGNGYSGLIAANALWTGVLLVSVFWLGRGLAGPAVGFAAAFLVGFYPGVVGLSRNFAPHYSMVAMSAACFALLLRTADFRSASRSLLLGVVVGLGVLTNPKILFFVLPPFATCVAKACRENKEKRLGQTAANAAAAAATGALISASWWAPAIADLFGFVGDISLRAHYRYPAASLWAGWISWRAAYYPTALHFEMSPVLSATAVAALAFSFVRAEGSLARYRAEWLAWLFGPLALLTVIDPKNDYYIAPAMAPLGLLTVYAVSRLPVGTRTKAAAAAILLVFGLTQELELSWEPGVLPQWAVRSRLQTLWPNDACRGSFAPDCLFNVYPALPANTNEQRLAGDAATAFARRHSSADRCAIFYPSDSSLDDYQPHGYFVRMLQGALEGARFVNFSAADGLPPEATANPDCVYLLIADDAWPAASAKLGDRSLLNTLWSGVSAPRGDSLFLIRLGARSAQ